MTDTSTTKTDGASKDFSIVLGILSLITFLICLGGFIWGSVWYWRYTKSPTGWLILLYLLPPIAQLAGLLFLFFRVRVEKAVLPFYTFYLAGMFVSLISYCLLWIAYSGINSYLNLLSYFAVLAVLTLLIPVALMTYAIMWKSPEVVTTELQVSDIRDFAGLCARIGEESGKSASSLSGVIMGALPEAFQARLTEIATSGQCTLEDTACFVVELNKELGKQDFFRKANFDEVNGVDHVTSLLRDGTHRRTREVHELHRELINAAFPRKFHKRPRPGRSRVVFEGLLWHLKQGARKIPFWALTFFFTVFLVVTYLFGFAFAFHDKQVTNDGKPPALYMTKPQLAAIRYEKRNEQPALEHEYKFYFDQPSATAKYGSPSFDETQYSTDRSKDWGESKNLEHLADLTEAILQASQEDTKIRVELKGMADDGLLAPGGPYSSNYELSEARAQVLKEMVIRRLSDQYRWEPDIQWSILPLSSETSQREEIPDPAKQSFERGQQDLKKQVQNLRTTETMQMVDEDYLNVTQKKKLKFRLGYIQYLAKAGKLTPDNEQQLIEKTNRLLKLMKLLSQQSAQSDNLPKEEGLRVQRDLEATRKLIKYADEEIQEAVYIDSQAKKRVVIAIVKPSQNPFYVLSLMDHVYFSIYTITTTGYGDIIPTTAYAKFLCSLANILEVFFLVVFFNALISVKEDHNELRSRRLGDVN